MASETRYTRQASLQNPLSLHILVQRAGLEEEVSAWDVPWSLLACNGARRIRQGGLRTYCSSDFRSITPIPHRIRSNPHNINQLLMHATAAAPGTLFKKPFAAPRSPGFFTQTPFCCQLPAAL